MGVCQGWAGSCSARLKTPRMTIRAEVRRLPVKRSELQKIGGFGGVPAPSRSLPANRFYSLGSAPWPCRLNPLKGLVMEHHPTAPASRRRFFHLPSCIVGDALSGMDCRGWIVGDESCGMDYEGMDERLKMTRNSATSTSDHDQRPRPATIGHPRIAGGSIASSGKSVWVDRKEQRIGKVGMMAIIARIVAEHARTSSLEAGWSGAGGRKSLNGWRLETRACRGLWESIVLHPPRVLSPQGHWAKRGGLGD